MAGPRTIGVVCCEMEGEPTGVGRYTEELLTALVRVPRASEWRLRLYFQGDPFDHPLWADAGGGRGRVTPIFDGRPGARPVLWEQLRLPRLLRREPVDLVFSPGYSLPRGHGRPSLVTIHDLSFEHLPGDFGFREVWRRRLLARCAARAATRVLTDTRRTADELQQRYGVPSERVAVVPLGVSPRFLEEDHSVGPEERREGRREARAAGDDRTRHSSGAAIGPDRGPCQGPQFAGGSLADASGSALSAGQRSRAPAAEGAPPQAPAGPLAELGVRQPYLLMLGSVLPRRRVDLVLRALGRLLREAAPTGDNQQSSGGRPTPSGPVSRSGFGSEQLDEVRLVIAGHNRLPRRGELERLIQDADLADRVVRLGYVDDDLLPALYARALGTIYVSEYEGYGLPPLESLAAGVPVLVSDAPALAELWPDYPFRCARLEVETLTEGMRRLVLDGETRRSVVSEGPDRVRSLTWERAAERFVDEVETAWRVAGEAGR